MKPLLTSNLKVKFLGITPVLKDETGVLNPQEIVALSALLTFKGKSIQNLLKESKGKGQNLNEKIKNILRRSSLKGHASMATTPVLCFSYEASKFLDSALTGMVFASALMASGRRTDTKVNDIVYPTTILKNKKPKTIYKEASEKNINFFNWLLAQSVPKDEASKMLQYGIYGTGIIQLSVESLVSFKREYEIEKKWFPEEISLLLNKIEKELKKFGVDLLYITRLIAPRNTYHYPHIFKDPRKSNLVRDLMRNKKNQDAFQIVSSIFFPTPELRRKLTRLKQEIKKAVKSKNAIKKKWLELILFRQQIARDYNLAANIKILSSVAWRVWGDKKRHRTVPQIVESVYYCVGRAAKIFSKYRVHIKKEKFTTKILNEIDTIFSIPPIVRSNKEFLYLYLNRALDSLDAYNKLINLGVKVPDALFVIPRGLKLDILQEYNLYNLIAGYYPLRICSTAEEELRRLTIKEVIAIKKLLTRKGLNWLGEHIVPKCQIIGFCPEEKSCPMILSSVKNYNENFHQEMKTELNKQFEKNLKKLGRWS